MRITATIILFGALAGVGGLRAQSASPFIAESKQAFTGVKNNLQKMAEAMPEDNYSFKPTPEMRSFGQLMAHVADTQANLCSTVQGQKKSVDAGSKTSKADIVAAVRESSAICDAAFDSLTAATAAQPAAMNRSKLGLLQFNTGHSLEEYGYGSVYLRLKGVVPPSSAGRGR